MSRKKKPTEPTGPQVRVCACGICGVSWEVTRDQRKRRWAEGCPQKAARQRAQSVASWERLRAAEREGKPFVRTVTRNSSDRRKALETVRQKVNICKICFNLPHARAKKGCVLCGLPYAP